jgi:PAS domain S-box-containing protein
VTRGEDFFLFPTTSRALCRLAAYAVLAIAGLTLVGWWFDITLLKSIRSEWNSMKVVTAICLLMSATALLWLQAEERWRRALCGAFSIAVCATASASLIVYGVVLSTGSDPNWDTVPVVDLFLGPTDRMAAATALIFLGLGCALLLLGTGRRRLSDAAHLLVLPLAVMSYLVLAGYIFSAPSLHAWLGVPVALHTGVAFCLLCLGILCARTDTWLMGSLSSMEAGGLMARRLLPILLMLPLTIGVLRVEGERAGLFESEVGVALVAATYAVSFLFLVWWSSRAANRLQRTAEQALREERGRLDLLVRERTEDLSRTVQELRDETTQRMVAEQEAVRNARYARNLIETSLDPLVTISPDGKITDVNAATELVTGVPRALLIGSDFSSYFTEPENANAGYLQVLREGALRDYPLTIRHASGCTTDVLYNATIYRSQADDGQGIFAAARDVTERKKLEQELAHYSLHLEELVKQRTSELEMTAEELARSNKDLEQFAYVSSHDLQEPLRAVAGFMSLLRQQHNERLDDEAREYIGHAVAGAERMQALINDLLAYSRVGTQGVPPGPVSMNEVLDVATANLSAAIGESRALITNDPLPIVTADRSQMIQLMQNLVGNAIKFRGPRAPEIHVSARREENTWLFGVRDNGIGIEAVYHDRIFMIFQRLHSRTQYPGTGIGLALCKRILERHSGRIWLESRPGEGTIFWFTIPDKGGDE